MMEYVEKLLAADRPELAAQLKRAWKNAIVFAAKEALSGTNKKVSEGAARYFRYDSKYIQQGEIPVGASKTGGYPDLPPEIPYPEMTGFTRIHLHCREEYRNEIVPESAMQLLAQINLRELAESGADLEHKLPRTGMLYFFYSHYGCDIFNQPMMPADSEELKIDNPEKAQIAKVIYWDGDMTTLRRTPPQRPYCEGIVPGLEKERAIAFFAEDNYDAELLDDCEEICDILEIEENELIPHGDKLLGVPWTVNPPYMFGNEINLIQMSADEGSVVSYFWAVTPDALAKQYFASAKYWEDCD